MIRGAHVTYTGAFIIVTTSAVQRRAYGVKSLTPQGLQACTQSSRRPAWGTSKPTCSQQAVAPATALFPLQVQFFQCKGVSLYPLSFADLLQAGRPQASALPQRATTCGLSGYLFAALIRRLLQVCGRSGPVYQSKTLHTICTKSLAFCRQRLRCANDE